MMKDNIDYSQYSLDQLWDIKRHIDPEIAPENYQNLMTELKKRDKEIKSREALKAEKRKRQSGKRKKKIIFFIKALSWIQIVGGLLLFIFILWIGLKNPFNLKNLLLLPVLLVPIYSIVAGYLLLRARRIGIYLSIVNQFMQLFSIQMDGFIYQYNLPFGIYLFMEDMIIGIKTNSDLIFRISSGEEIGTTYFALNLFSILAIIMLGKYKSLINRSSGLDTPLPPAPELDR